MFAKAVTHRVQIQIVSKVASKHIHQIEDENDYRKAKNPIAKTSNDKQTYCQKKRNGL